MRQNITEWDFMNAFEAGMYTNNFTRAGLFALYEYLIDLEEGQDDEMEWDIVAIACTYTEYASLKELQNDYADIETLEQLEQRTTVIPVTDSEPNSKGLIIVAY